MAEGAPLLREYVGKTCIEGSNPSGSAKLASAPSPERGFFIGKSAFWASQEIPINPLQAQSLVGVGMGV